MGRALEPEELQTAAATGKKNDTGRSKGGATVVVVVVVAAASGAAGSGGGGGVPVELEGEEDLKALEELMELAGRAWTMIEVWMYGVHPGIPWALLVIP